ncbi:MAG: hypothetical protein AAFX99_02800, partial [Myxococcota bacterium]
MNEPSQTMTYTVVLVDFESKTGAVERLQKAFGIDRVTAGQFIDNMPVVVKRKAPPEVARTYHTKLIQIGAQVEMRREDPERPLSFKTGMSIPALTPEQVAAAHPKFGAQRSQPPTFGTQQPPNRRSTQNLP